MILYRAMCKKEYVKLVNTRRIQGLFFSPSLKFIRDRVQDGKFNLSHQDPSMYNIIVQVKIRYPQDRRDYLKTLNDNEIKVRRYFKDDVEILEINKISENELEAKISSK